VTAEISWCRLSQSGVLRFDGLDVPSFLQGQLTNNVQALDNEHSQYSGYCTPKGRLLATMLLWQRDDAYCMMLPRERCEPLRKRLSMYILRAKVKAHDDSDAHALFGLNGAGAATMAAQFIGTVPSAIHAVAHGNGVSILKLPLNRYLIVAALSEAGKIEASLTAAAAVSCETLWTQLDIEAGIPTIVAATQEQFVPQTVNFDLIGAVSFDKGCYPGQEIVARTHYLGKVKQRMIRASLRSNDAPAAGDKLYSEPYGDQASGMIVNAVRTGTGTYEVLAVVQTSNVESANVHWQSPQGPALKDIPLPYPVI